MLSEDITGDNISEEPSTKKRKTTRLKKGTKVTEPEHEKQPGHETYPLNNFSLTISKCKGDVPLALLELIHNWIVSHCDKGGVATDVRKRAFNFLL